ncbi:MAG: hypothetical protein L0Z46_08420 [Nitrospiraceae bacterium]|nr:hypothetical protein [Nitrospiraceae bacterium]
MDKLFQTVRGVSQAVAWPLLKAAQAGGVPDLRCRRHAVICGATLKACAAVPLLTARGGRE